MGTLAVYPMKWPVHHRLLPRLFCVFMGLWLITAFPLWTNVLASSLRGAWVDQAFSTVLTEKYGSPVQVRDVYFERWYLVHFGAIRIDSNSGTELISASGGTLYLSSLSFFKDGINETYLQLNDIAFTKEYYKDSAAAGAWGHLMRRPIHVDQLCLRVVQDRSGMQVTVTDCRSEEVKIDGSIKLDQAGVRKNDLQISISTWAALRSIV